MVADPANSRHPSRDLLRLTPIRSNQIASVLDLWTTHYLGPGPDEPTKETNKMSYPAGHLVGVLPVSTHVLLPLQTSTIIGKYAILVSSLSPPLEIRDASLWYVQSLLTTMLPSPRFSKTTEDQSSRRAMPSFPLLTSISLHLPIPTLDYCFRTHWHVQSVFI
jgi:hypothetical protein